MSTATAELSLIGRERAKSNRWRLVSVNGLTHIEIAAESERVSYVRFLTVQFERDWSVLPYREDWREIYMSLSRQTTWEPTSTGLLFGDWHEAPCPYIEA